MLKVGITGGIGSGKSVVCQVFHTLGIPVFNADDAAKHLMESDPALISSIRRLLGDEVYDSGKLDRAKVAATVYQAPEKLQQLNALVHPATILYARAWMKNQLAPYIIKEAAIFFESNSYKEMNIMVGVYAPKELRLSRAMSRSHLSRARVLAIMDEQMDDEEKMKRCDFVVTNDGQQAILPRILQLHQDFLDRAKNAT
jgi:dephospho-CoA kinase